MLKWFLLKLQISLTNVVFNWYHEIEINPEKKVKYKLIVCYACAELKVLFCWYVLFVNFPNNLKQWKQISEKMKASTMLCGWWMMTLVLTKKQFVFDSQWWNQIEEGLRDYDRKKIKIANRYHSSCSKKKSEANSFEIQLRMTV